MSVEDTGWDAIQQHLSEHYGSQKPQHWGTVRSYLMGGSDPLDGVSAYSLDSPAHWHYITFGFSELGEKTSENIDVSGWGFELSFRLKRNLFACQAPKWPVVFLQTLARYVFNTGCPFDHEHYIQIGGPLTKEEHTDLVALVFIVDSVLGTINTPNGKMTFLTPIGITENEFDFCGQDGPEKLLPVLLSGNSLGVTDPLRKQLINR